MTNVIVHIDEESRWEQLLVNLEYFAEKYGSESRIVVVVNGPAVRSFNGYDVHPEYGERMRTLAEKGVVFKICANSLNNRQIPEDRLPDIMEVVPQGVAYIVERQGDGYAYIKP
ncbi:DsrE family protein [Arcanobacterium haemolyticum]|nr:DsrE family protein [Arcanobacterium haemolyticum]